MCSRSRYSNAVDVNIGEFTPPLMASLIAPLCTHCVSFLMSNLPLFLCRLISFPSSSRSCTAHVHIQPYPVLCSELLDLPQVLLLEAPNLVRRELVDRSSKARVPDDVPNRKSTRLNS